MYIEGRHMAHVVKALSSDVRLQILDMLTENDMNIQTVSQKLGISKTAALMHINLLEKAGFITTFYLNGSAGNQRICHKEYDRLVFDFDGQRAMGDDANYYETSIPMGNYFLFNAWPPCGLAQHNQIICHWDDPSVFCDVARVGASLVWTSYGFFEYLIPLFPNFEDKRITRIKLSFEASAGHMVKNHKALVLPETLDAQQLTPDLTDLTLWVNGVEVGSVLLEAGNDKELAVFTPAWWQTKPCHGEMVKLSITEEGCSINKKKVSEHTADELLALQRDFLSLRIGVKPDAEHINGFFLFGKDFGRYSMDLKAKFYISD